MEREDLKEKLASIKPYTFYGDDPPPRLSREPSKILQPLLEWAEKTHFSKGGLIGRKIRQHMPPPPKRPRNAYRLFFDEKKAALLAKVGKATRDEIQAVTPTIKQLWIDASAQELRRFEVLAKKEAEKYGKEVEAYEHAYPECARQLKIQAHQRKARARRTRQLKKGKLAPRGGDRNSPRRKKSATATKKVSKWLDQLSESDLATTETHSPKSAEAYSMECGSGSDSGSSAADGSQQKKGYSGAYKLPE